ncbi:MAG: L-rhamnose isomerase [Planctomycetes bacterium]|nr:L-rhamnose isomerase [Planctomycetota bacterium]
MDKTALKARLRQQKIETPSWGYQDSGTRFGVFAQPWAAKTIEEKFEDAGQVHKYTGICPTVALHIPWDTCADWSKAKAMAASHNLTIGAINPNVFQDKDYQFGSICHRDERVRAKAIKAHVDCIEIGKATGSDCLSLWFADGTNYPGQDSFRERKHRMQDSLAKVYAALPKGMRMIVEYKFFEPAFYHTDIQDWGSSLLLCQKLGEQAQVLVDTGHHSQGCNIEHIVAILLDEGKLGGFHFNSRKYADDDLTVGSLNPYELFLIYNELVGAEHSSDAKVKACAQRVAYMFDQCHTHKPTVEAIMQSAIHVQEIYAKALLVDQAALASARAAGDLVQAEEVLQDAYKSDVRPMLAELRQDMGLDPEPLKAFRRSGYLQKKAEERQARRAKAGQAAQTMGAGFPT